MIKDTGVTEMVDQDGDNITLLTHTGNTINNSITITNVRKSHTGYYWVRTPSLIVCNASLTVLTGEYVDGVHHTYIYIVVLSLIIVTSKQTGVYVQIYKPGRD